ncbi:hypothetical protein [Streptomyces sp. NPDC055036]
MEKAKPTVNAVKSEAKRMGASNQEAASRKAMLKEVPGDIRQQGRRESTQDKAEGRKNS